MRTTAINACFDEEAQHMGENGPCQPNVALPIHLNKPSKELDEEVRRVFDHAGAMLCSLSSAAKIVELVRDLYDEYLREHRSAVPCSGPHPRSRNHRDGFMNAECANDGLSQQRGSTREDCRCANFSLSQERGSPQSGVPLVCVRRDQTGM